MSLESRYDQWKPLFRLSPTADTRQHSYTSYIVPYIDHGEIDRARPLYYQTNQDEQFFRTTTMRWLINIISPKLRYIPASTTSNFSSGTVPSTAHEEQQVHGGLLRCFILFICLCFDGKLGICWSIHLIDGISNYCWLSSASELLHQSSFRWTQVCDNWNDRSPPFWCV